MATRNTRATTVAPGVFALLRAIGTEAALRAAMLRAGYSAEEHATGWRLLDEAAARSVDFTAPPTSTEERADLPAWREATLPRLRAALSRLHPEQAAQLLPEGETTDPSEEVRVFLDRVDALERTGRTGNSAGGKVLETLARRGLTPAERSRVRGLLVAAHVRPALGTEAAPVSPTHTTGPSVEMALAQWYADWSATAASASSASRAGRKRGAATSDAEPRTRTPKTPTLREGAAPCPPAAKA